MSQFAYALTLTEEERRQLMAVVSTPGIEAQLQRRAHILLLLDQGLTAPEVERYLKISRSTIYSIALRYQDRGLKEAVFDRRRSGTPCTIPKEAFFWIRALAKQDPQSVGVNALRWTITKLQEYIRTHCEASGFPELNKLSRSYLWRILQDEGQRKNQEERVQEQIEVTKETGHEVVWGNITIGAEWTNGFWRPFFKGTTFDLKGPAANQLKAQGLLHDKNPQVDLRFVVGFYVPTGAIAAVEGYSEQVPVFESFLTKLDKMIPRGVVIELMHPRRVQALPAPLHRLIFSQGGRFSLVDEKRYGDLLPTMLNYVRCMMWKNTLSNLRAPTTEALSKQIIAALDGWNTVDMDTFTAPCSMS